MPVVGIAISIALLTQVETEIFARAGVLVAVGAALWVVNWLFVRREGERDAAMAPRST